MSNSQIVSERFISLRESQLDDYGKPMPVIQLAHELLNKDCIKNYTVDVVRQEIGKVERKGKFPQLFLIEGYCKYFKVTSDFLLGIRDTRVIDENIAMINKATGLSDSSIKALQTMLLEDKNSKGFYNLSLADTLNIMLDHSMLINIVKDFRNFLNAKYTVPVYHDINENKWIYPKSNFSKTDDLYWLNMASSEQTPSDNVPIALTDSFFDTVSLKAIEQKLYTIRDLYFEKEEKR